MSAIEKIKDTVNGLTDFEREVFDYFELNYSDLETNLEDNANFVDFGWVAKTIPTKQLRGVWSSLEKKDLIFFAECDETTYYTSGLAVACWFYMFKRDEFEKCPKDILEQYV